ncbi:hypothetical protein KBD68_00985 [Candidatus Woesebacteria bacterium]|nr:hypothetical protein [Candidatus Woesebacteria bacterium]
MRKILGLLLVIVLSICGVSQTLAQETDQNLWGIWKLTNQYAPDYNIFMIFTPNGSWGSQNIEGLFYGRYAANGSYLVVNATIEYSEIGKWDQTFQYQVMGNNLHLSDNSGTFQDYVKVTTFTGFGFIHCPSTVVSNMFVGSYGHVAYTDGRASRERVAPGTSAKVIAQLREGAIFLVVGDPQCADDITWWPINDNPYNPGTPGSNNIVTGWIGEGENGVAYIEPIGWIETSMVPYYQPENLVTNLSELAQMSGATLYGPGQYPYIDKLSRSLATGEASGVLSSVYDFVDSSYDLVKDVNLGGNPAHIICMATSLAGTKIVPALPSDETIGFVCFVYDVGKDVLTFNPVGLTISVALEVLSNPDRYIDPWLDPVNRWVDSRPITRFVCWITPDICPPELRPK